MKQKKHLFDFPGNFEEGDIVKILGINVEQQQNSGVTLDNIPPYGRVVEVRKDKSDRCFYKLSRNNLKPNVRTDYSFLLVHKSIENVFNNGDGESYVYFPEDNLEKVVDLNEF